MKRRVFIFGAALAIYVALILVTWIIGTRQAYNKTEWQLDFAVLDLHETVTGAIDTMLGHIARTAVRQIREPRFFSREEMSRIAGELNIDEVNIVDKTGRIISSNDPSCPGVEMAGDPVMGEFMQLTNGVTAVVSQPFRSHALNPRFRAKYLAVAFPGGNGFVQVGMDESHFGPMMPEILGFVCKEWNLGQTGCFLCADISSGRLISNPARHKDEAKTLVDTGYDIDAAKAFEIIADGKNPGVTFKQHIFGEDCFCRTFVFGEHRFVAVLPQREFYDTRTTFVSVFSVLMFIILSAFALFLNRIFSDSDALKAFYKEKEALLAKDMEIAKTIQSSALPKAILETQTFGVCADMQPARDVGGDFYDFFALDATHIAFLVADVSGKGVTAALYMMTVKTLIKDTLLSVLNPALALTKVNDDLCANNTANMFLTAWVGVLDTETGVISYANAGHNPPIAMLGTKNEYLRAKSGPILAFMPGVKYKLRMLRVAPGDALFLYTDGVTEALDSAGTLFGEERLLDAVKAVPEHDAHSLCAVVSAVVAAFSDGVSQADDITVLAIRYMAPPCGLSRSFSPTRQGVALASDFLDESLLRLDAKQLSFKPSKLSAKLHIILDEICSNIVNHSDASGFDVDIECEENPPLVRITFADDGTAYDPVAHTDPDTTLPAEERPIGGLGILMVRKMSTSIAYNRARNRNFLTVTLAV